MAAVIIGEQCPYCTKFRSPLSIIRHPGGITICLDCEIRHIEALRALSTGTFKGECSECGRPAEPDHEAKMAVHFENGRYRVMCLDCDRIYVRKRKELYGQTPFGQARGLDR